MFTELLPILEIKDFIRVFFFDIRPLAFFVFFGVFRPGEYDATVRKFGKVDFFRCKPDLSTRNGSRLEWKKIFELELDYPTCKYHTDRTDHTV